MTNALSAATLHRLEELHASMKSVMTALPADALDWTPAPEVNSIAVVVTHVCGSERFWIGEKVGGIAANRDRSAEFTVRATSAQQLSTLLDEALELAASVLDSLDVSELGRHAGVSSSGFKYDVAWALQHALEHVAVHTGHVELMRQWWESQTQP